MVESFSTKASISLDGKVHIEVPGGEPGEEIEVTIRPRTSSGGWHKPGRANVIPLRDEALRRESIYGDD